MPQTKKLRARCAYAAVGDKLEAGGEWPLLLMHTAVVCVVQYQSRAGKRPLRDSTKAEWALAQTTSARFEPL
ncbi:hypothetical protein E4U57_003311 [Claviceps arundinis]|uniref:Uncharacterized protein n=1 Tax=Claviceps arundinis TaxID=1623583 RepID=A0ABQ7PJR7_9HYPO|nr:hypothetical protein E4U57_003311 [Claviceps arundinis]